MAEAAAHSQPSWVLLAYLIAGVCFILALRGLSSPETSRRGNFTGMLGMAIAVGTTLATHQLATLPEIAGAMLVGGGIGLVTARKIQMTAMPQLVAAFHSLVGMAAVLVGAAAFLNPAAFGIVDPAGNILLVASRWDSGSRLVHHILRLCDRVPETEQQYVGQADPAAGSPRDQFRHHGRDLALIAYFTQDQGPWVSYHRGPVVRDQFL
jgi:NAD(P) transhydrogenase subunit beta